MDKKILAHKEFVEARLSELEKRRDKKTTEAARDLLAYHDAMTRNFQHERQIHLYVTLFFAGLLILVLAATVILPNVVTLLTDNLLVNLALLMLSLILFVLEMFYIRHYYQLENRTQKLYELTKRIYKLLA